MRHTVPMTEPIPHTLRGAWTTDTHPLPRSALRWLRTRIGLSTHPSTTTPTHPQPPTPPANFPPKTDRVEKGTRPRDGRGLSRASIGESLRMWKLPGRGRILAASGRRRGPVPDSHVWQAKRTVVPAALSVDARAALTDILGPDNVRTDQEARLGRTGGLSYLDLVRY